MFYYSPEHYNIYGIEAYMNKYKQTETRTKEYPEIVRFYVILCAYLNIYYIYIFYVFWFKRCSSLRHRQTDRRTVRLIAGQSENIIIVIRIR